MRINNDHLRTELACGETLRSLLGTLLHCWAGLCGRSGADGSHWPLADKSRYTSLTLSFQKQQPVFLGFSKLRKPRFAREVFACMAVLCCQKFSPFACRLAPAEFFFFVVKGYSQPSFSYGFLKTSVFYGIQKWAVFSEVCMLCPLCIGAVIVTCFFLNRGPPSF